MHEPLPDDMFENDDFSRFTEPEVAKKVYGKGKSTLHVALEVAHKVERAKALTGPHDSVGVLLYNVNVRVRLNPSQISHLTSTLIQ